MDYCSLFRECREVKEPRNFRNIWIIGWKTSMKLKMKDMSNFVFCKYSFICVWSPNKSNIFSLDSEFIS